MRRLSRMGAALGGLLAISSLGGCSSERVVAKPELIRLKPPAELLRCAPAPDPRLVVDDRSYAGYVADLEAAGENCREKLRDVKKWAE